MLDCLILTSDLAIASSFLAVFHKIRATRSASGLSLQTLIAIVIARCIHLLTHGLALHYRPEILPKAVFHSLDVVSACAGFACLYSFCAYHYSTYEVDKDNFGIQILERFNCMPKVGALRHKPVVAALLLHTVVAIAAFVYYFVRPGPLPFLTRYFGCYYESLYSLALFPQLWMFHKDKHVPSVLATFIVSIAVGRICIFTFWWSYPLVHPWSLPANRSVQMGSEALNLLILSDFLYYWGRSKFLGHKDVVLGDDYFPSFV